MPMPSIPGGGPQPQAYKPPTYQPPSVGAYPARNTTPYPVSNNSSYATSQSHASHVAAPTSSEIDEAMKQLTDDLINGVLKDAQNADLESLIDNDEKLTELIADSQISKNLTRKREELADFNRDQAAQNLSLKPEFELLRSKLHELAQRQNELRDRYVSLQNKLGNSLSSDTIFSLLQVATEEQETLSDDTKMNFYDGDLAIDEFIKNFVEGRKLYQLRKIKADKLKTILQAPQQLSGGGGGGIPRPGRPAPPVPGALRHQMPPVPNHGMGGYPIGHHQPIRYNAQYPSYPR